MIDWQQIIAEHSEQVWTTVRRLVTPEEAPGCFRGAFVLSHEVAGRDAVSDWHLLLQRCAAQAAMVELRKRPEGAPTSAPSGELGHLLADLTERQALMFCLRYISGFTYQEIAMELRMPLDGVGAAVHEVGGDLAKRLLQDQPRPADDELSPGQAADEALEEAVERMRQADIPPLPPGLSEAALKDVMALPEISFEKPPERSRMPMMIALVLLALVGAGVWWHIAHRPKPPLMAFGQVAQALKAATSATYHMTRSVELPDKRLRKVEADVWAADGGKLRQELDPPGTIIIWDMAQHKALTLEEMKQRATLRDTWEMFDETRPVDAIALLKGLAPTAGEAVEQTTIRGQTLQGFKVNWPDGPMKLWADASSRLPVLVELALPRSSPPSTVLLSDIQWNIQVPEQLLSLKAPEGYELSAIKVNLKPATELDLIKALEAAARLNGGKFPEEFDRASMSRMVAALKDKLPKDKQTPEYRQASEALEADLLQLGRGWLFISESGNGADWTYAGSGAFLGSLGPVLWYRPASDKPYRLIDASLAVRVMPADRLPDVPATKLEKATTRPEARQ